MCNLITIRVLTVLNERKRRQLTCILIEAVCYFSIKKSSNFAAHNRHYHLIDESSTAATAVVASVYVYSLFLVASQCIKRTSLCSFSPLRFSSCHTHIYLSRLNIVGIVEEKQMKMYVHFTYDKYCSTIDLRVTAQQIYYIDERIDMQETSRLSSSKHTRTQVQLGRQEERQREKKKNEVIEFFSYRTMSLFNYTFFSLASEKEKKRLCQ